MMNALVDLFIYIVGIVIVCGLSLWYAGQLPITEHSHRVARIVVAISVIISVLLYVFYRG